MRKHLAALLSMFGLASSTLPAQGQAAPTAPKGSSTKSEQQIKLDKQKQEKQAAGAEALDKHKGKTSSEAARSKTEATFKHKKQKAGTEAGAAKSDIHIKGEKQAAEAAAGKKQTQLKLKQKQAPAGKTTPPATPK